MSRDLRRLSALPVRCGDQLPAVHPEAPVGILHRIAFVGHDEYGLIPLMGVIPERGQNQARVFETQGNTGIT